MLKATYLDFHDRPGSAPISGWYITDGNGAMIAGAHRHEDQASCLRTLQAMGG